MAIKKKIMKHLASDIKTFKHEADEDKKLMKSIREAHAMREEQAKKLGVSYSNKSHHSKKHDPKHHSKKHKDPKSRSKKLVSKTLLKTPHAKAKVKKVMEEYKSGSLHSGSKKGPRVTNRKQAIAIALHSARKHSK